MKKVLVGLMTGLLCIMPAAGVMAEEAAAEMCYNPSIVKKYKD